MARNYDGGNDSLHTSQGGLTSWTFGTYVAVIRRVGTNWGNIATLHNSGGTALSGIEIGDGAAANALHYQSNGSAARSTFTIDEADGWVLVAAGKATGSSAPRMHKYVYSTGTWTHQDGSTNLANSTGTSATMRFGEWEGGDDFNGDIAVVGAWISRNLTDAEVEQLPYSIADWLALAPTEIWVFDQSDTSQAVASWTGSGANQTSLTGTTVSTNSAPISYGHPVEIANGFSAGGTAHTQGVAGTSTATGSLVRATATTKAGSSTPAGSITKAIARALAGSSTPAGAVSRSTSRSLAGSTTPAGALTRALSRLLGGTATPSGSATREITRTLAGESAPTGTTAKTTERSLGGSATPAGTVVKSIARLLAGSATASGLITRAISRLLGGSSTPTGTVTNDEPEPPPSDAFTVTVGPPVTSWSATTADTAWRTEPPITGWTATAPRR